uniref:tRNA dimethylallyltransferase n=1 Tax=Anopheles epiroticus TaxID=199890 RepID=A0A182PV57_9DIPT
MSSDTPLVVILGSTGTGKTKLSLELAARYGGEVISADSMQVYTGLDIVTAKATKEEQQQAVHHLLDVIDSLLAANRMPIIVGGTNYYIESILWKVLLNEGVKKERVRSHLATYQRDTIEPNKKQLKADGGAPAASSKSELERLLEELPRMESSDALERFDSDLLHRVLQRVDPESADRLHPNNKRKIIRD